MAMAGEAHRRRESYLVQQQVIPTLGVYLDSVLGAPRS